MSAMLFGTIQDFREQMDGRFEKISSTSEKFQRAVSRKEEIEGHLSQIMFDLDELLLKSILNSNATMLIQSYKEKAVEEGEKELVKSLNIIESQKLSLGGKPTDILNNWFLEHLPHPFPTTSEKKLLMEQTGLTKNQITNWFINTRGRAWKKTVGESVPKECIFQQGEIVKE